MSTSSTLRIPLSLPSALVTTPTSTSRYTLQFSLHHVERDTDIFIEKHYQVSELPSSSPAGQDGVVASLKRTEIPRFSGGGEVVLRAHFWKAGRLVESIGCGLV